MSLGEESGVDTTPITPGYLLIDRFAGGRITSSSDYDYYEVTLEPGTYFLWVGSDTYNGAYGLTLDVFDGFLNFVDSGYGSDSAYVSIDVTMLQTYTVQISSLYSGGYGASASFLYDPYDDVDGDVFSADALSPGVTYSRELNFVSDVDSFKIAMGDGTRYFWSILSDEIPDIYLTAEDGMGNRVTFGNIGWGISDYYLASLDETVYLTVSSNSFVNTGRYSLFYQATLTSHLPVDAGSPFADRLDASVASEIWGWDGDDTLYGSSGGDYLIGGWGADRLHGGAGSDDLRGEQGNDQLAGGAGADRLTGAGGADRLDGGAGADRMAGGTGNDTYVVDNAGDFVVEAAGGGVDHVRSSISCMLDEQVENLTLTGSTRVKATGNALANVLQGNGAANVLNGGGGNDTLNGGWGNDTLIAGTGRDRLDGGAGADRMQGDAGDDLYFVDSTGDAVIEAAGGGRDTVGSRHSHTLGANVENLTLIGAGTISGAGNALANALTGNGATNWLDGRAGNDVLNGGGGADRLIGGAGRDLLTGGAGADVFVYRSATESGPGAPRDVIMDFGLSDRINLGAIDARAAIGGDQAFSFIGSQGFSGRAGELSHRGGIVRGDTNGDGLADFEIRIANGASLDASDFIL